MGPRDAPPDQAQTARRRERLAREVGVVLAFVVVILWLGVYPLSATATASPAIGALQTLGAPLVAGRQ